MKDRKHVPRTVPLALAAAREAFQDAGIFPNDLSLEEKQQIGVVLGTGGGGLTFVVLVGRQRKLGETCPQPATEACGRTRSL